MTDTDKKDIDSVYQKTLLDILKKKQDIETSLNDFKKQQEDHLSKLNNIIIPFNSNCIQKIDSSTTEPTFDNNSNSNTFIISRTNNNKGGSFPRFKFRRENSYKIDGTMFKKIKITFRWAGSTDSYNYHNLANKTWCIGYGGGASGCRSDSNDHPPITPDFVSYIVNITNKSVLKNNNIEWFNWKGPDLDQNLDYKTYPCIWEFKEIVFILDQKASKKKLNDNFNKIAYKLSLLKNDIFMLKENYDDKNKYKINEEWNNVIKKSIELDKTYNDLLHKYNDYNTDIGSSDNSITVSKSKNLEYLGFIFLIVITIYIIVRIMVSTEETGIENIILTLMIMTFIYYIYTWYATKVSSIIKDYTPGILYNWIPDSVKNFFKILFDSINNKLLVFDYVK